MFALETIETHTIPLAQHPMKWVFEKNGSISPQQIDQIWSLKTEVAKELWDKELRSGIFSNETKMRENFQKLEVWSSATKSNQEIKQWLHDRGIPFSQKVFWLPQPDSGFVLTWKMLIEHSDKIFFANDEVIWDLSMNWGLVFDHNDEFIFAKSRI